MKNHKWLLILNTSSVNEVVFNMCSFLELFINDKWSSAWKYTFGFCSPKRTNNNWTSSRICPKKVWHYFHFCYFLNTFEWLMMSFSASSKSTLLCKDYLFFFFFLITACHTFYPFFNSFILFVQCCGTSHRRYLLLSVVFGLEVNTTESFSC